MNVTKKNNHSLAHSVSERLRVLSVVLEEVRRLIQEKEAKPVSEGRELIIDFKS